MSEGRRIARAAGVVGGLTLASRVTGLLRDVVTGFYFGAGPVADAFFVAFRIPNLLRRLVGEGAMSVAFVPVLGEVQARRGAPAAAHLLRTAASGFGLLLAAVTVAGALSAPFWLGLLAPGFTATPDTADLTISLARWLFAYLPLICLAALYGAFLNVRRRFIAPAVSPVLLNLAIIAAAVGLAPTLGAAALVLGVLAGGVAQLGLQLLALRRTGVSGWPAWPPWGPGLGRMLGRLAPATLGAAMYQVNVLVSTSLATLLPAGSVSALWYAGRLLEFPIGLVAVAIGTAALPTFTAQAARGALAELRHNLTTSLAMTSYLAIPASVALWILARPITAVLFQRGAFDAQAVAATAAALQGYAVGLWALSLVRVIAPAFYALGDVRTPLRAAAAAFVTNGLAALALVGALPRGEGTRLGEVLAGAAAALRVADLGQAGLALAASIAVAVNALLLVAPLSRRLGGLEFGDLAAAVARASVASLAMAAVLVAFGGGGDWVGRDGSPAGGTRLALLIAAGGATFAVAALCLGGREVAALRRLLRARLDGA